MPRYFYVRSNGSNSPALTIDSDTPYTSLQTGTFPSDANCYPSLEAAINAGLKGTPPAPGDFILVASDHNYQTDSGGTYDTTLNEPFANWAGFLTVVSVSTTNCDQYEAGAKEYCTVVNSDYYIYVSASFYGITWDSSRQLNLTGTNTCTHYFDCTFISQDQGRGFNFGAESSAILHDCHFISYEVGSSTVNVNTVSASSTIRMYGGSFTYDPAFTSTATRMFTEIQDGCELVFDGVDFSTATGWPALFQISTAAAESSGTLRLSNCKLPSGVPLTNTPTNPAAGGNILATNCSSDTAQIPYARHWEWLNNLATHETGFYRTGAQAYSNGTKISIRIDTTARCGQAEVFYFPLTQQYVDLTSSASDTLTFYILSTTQLKDGEVWLEALYDDAAVAGQVNYLSTMGDILSGGTELQTNTETWNNYTSQYRYEIVLNTGTHDPGAAGVVTVRVAVAKPSTTFYICPTPVLS